MFNTIILLHGDAVLSKMEMKKFKKGDTVINDWADATEVKRWKMSEKDEAIAELASKKCTYKKVLNSHILMSGLWNIVSVTKMVNS